MKLNGNLEKCRDLLVNFDHQNMSRELLEYKKFLTINEAGTPRDLFVYPKARKSLEGAQSVFQNLFSVIQKLTRYIVFEKPELIKFLGKSGIDIDALRLRHPETLINYARIDTIWSENRYKVLEFNARRPQMFEDADFYGRYFQSGFGLNSSLLEAENNSEEILQSIKHHYFLNTKKIEPENILLISNHLKEDISFSFFSKIQEIFPKTNICSIKTTELKDFYSQIQLNKKCLVYKNQIIDCIIIQNVVGKYSIMKTNGMIRDAKIAEAYRNGCLEVFSPPSSMIAGNKLLFNLLQNYETLSKLNLTKDEKESLEWIPLSIKSYSINSETISQKDKFVIKLSGKSNGIGIILGKELSDLEWRNKINELIANKQDFILQEFVEFQTDEIIDLSLNEQKPAYITLEPILINNSSKYEKPHISGYSARAILPENYTFNLKFNPAYNEKRIMFGSVIELN